MNKVDYGMEYSLNPINLHNYDSSHFDGKHYNNEPGTPYNFYSYEGKSTDFLNFFFNTDCTTKLPSRNPKNDFLAFNSNNNSNQSHDIQKNNEDSLQEGGSIYDDDINICPNVVAHCWNIGHATILIQLNNFFIITDPIFESYASPAPGFIIRSTPAACSISELPPIDIILISHNHYDHMNKPSIQKIKEKNPKAVILCPLNLGQRYLNKWKIKNYIEFDWRQYIDFHKSNSNFRPMNSNISNMVPNLVSDKDTLRITCMPARHASARNGFDWDEVLWCSWLLNFNDNLISIYFPGDTAVGPHFSEIYEQNNNKCPLDLLLCPIGPQLPSEMMRNVHLDGVEGKQMSEDIHAKTVVPIHHGVFPLGFKPEKTDLEIAVDAWNQGNSQNDLICWKIGGRVDYDTRLRKFVASDDEQIMNS